MLKLNASKFSIFYVVFSVFLTCFKITTLRKQNTCLLLVNPPYICVLGSILYIIVICLTSVQRCLHFFVRLSTLFQKCLVFCPSVYFIPKMSTVFCPSVYFIINMSALFCLSCIWASSPLALKEAR